MARAKNANGLPLSDLIAAVDEMVWRAMESAQQLGASPDVVIDRMVTAAGAHVCAWEGSAGGARFFRAVADRIEAGACDALTGENGGKPRRAN
jgi:G:T-mismatch repair DNA endonuclease (very short patch repair protein)